MRSTRQHFGASLALWLLSLAAGGCSFIFASGPPSNIRSCRTSAVPEGKAAPILDLIGAGLSVAGAALIAADTDAYEGSSSTGAAIALNLGWAALLAPAGVVGFNKTQELPAAKLELAQRQAGKPAGASSTPTRDSVEILLPLRMR